MTIQEIIESIDYCLECDNDRIPTTQEDLQTIKKALEKQIPKKPIEARRWLYDNGLICPVCSYSIYKLSFSYCHNCGQKIDWEKQ